MIGSDGKEIMWLPSRWCDCRHWHGVRLRGRGARPVEMLALSRMDPGSVPLHQRSRRVVLTRTTF